MSRNSNGQAPDRILRRKLSDQVFERLRDLMASGELAPGAPMPSERDLMERFGVGRPAVREALQHMQSMGLITINHGERSRVNALSADSVLNRVDDVARMLLSSEPDQLDHLKEARRMFECGLVRVATGSATPEDLQDLHALIDRQSACIGDAAQFVTLDIAFHNRIAAITGNPILVATSQSMLRWLFQYHGVLLHWSGKEEVTLTEHRDMADLIGHGDPDAAVRAMQAHLDRSNLLYVHPQGQAAAQV
ncbi:transcriptional regulator NanR [Paracoccus liaowanqingii]|uniref:Transcriptional regulator NanR n=1 Tax=Paracoccus liaowanqingii TaxID=2560053 RepID=A0A4Z1CQX8_9RHOB|nr:transcriptional regulator NanR [Paracoccus liaowanqingii]QDA35970.1 transcriptional regulator NanR [Paracoccus liaowanqingii]TGN67437.1 transcriptional regulator NanR [Paracoccus liaowanqingii]